MNEQPGRTFTERIETTGAELTERVKELAKQADTRRVVIKDQDGKELLSLPLTWGMAGGALAVVAAPLLAAVAAVGGAMANVRLEVERVSPPGSPWDTAQGRPARDGWVEDDPDWTPPEAGHQDDAGDQDDAPPVASPS
ncbi:DUF4342 domain-containing protein [Ornithinimicrobium pratense]|uniref:DUF4342 domain-containing protein n=1 Tax=Ornithinimicrobium pratense TaxID=2593973 RepID=A0A5J6V3Y6_9MICO|nr:DUF4342 domain-containing protein [Ornithinimicrobium pratense]QFG68609.1 DUF4342 domain-containing protein [Ornithinimicrobium pratense]